MTIQTSVKPNGHSPHRRIGSADATCPTCGQPVSKAIQSRIAAEEKARNERFEAEIHRAKLKAAEAAEKEVQKVRKQSQLDLAAARREAASAVMITLPGKIAEAVAGAQSQWHAEKLKLTNNLQEMKRQIENTHTPAHKRGEDGESDLFDAMTTAFKEPDRMWRVVRGQPGPDIVMEVVVNEAVAGKIIVDCKNISRWSNKFVGKILGDAKNEGADFCVIASNVLPAGEQQICIRDGVIIATPQRVVVLTHMLRRQIIENYRLKLTAAARDEKAERLLAYVVSQPCSDLMDGIVKVSAELADLDRSETAAHQKVWSKRADFIRAVADIHREFTDAVSAIIAGHSE